MISRNLQTLRRLNHLTQEEETGNIPIPTRGKHTFGTVTMGERGQIVIPEKAREIFGFNPGDSLIVLGDENQGGLGIMKADYFMEIVSGFLEKIMGRSNERVKKMFIFIIIPAVFILCAVFLTGRYLYGNLHLGERDMRNTRTAGFVQKQAKLENGVVINYGEGPANGPALLLIHGQIVSWHDYDRVLPELSKSFHVYAVDCFGHGGSTRTESLYSCTVNGSAFLWFIENVIKEDCFLSGHSSGGVLAAWIASEAPQYVKGLVLEDPPLFSVTPEEIKEGEGAFAWYDTYVVTHDFCSQDEERDFALYYLQHGYLLKLFGGLSDKIYCSALESRKAFPDSPIRIKWFPAKWLRVLLFMDDYDPRFGNSFYTGEWMEGVEQEKMLKKIKAPTIYLKANTRYGKDGVLYAANSDEDAERVSELIETCERINLD